MNFEIKEIDGLSGSMGHVYSVVLDGKENSLLEDFFSENKEYKKELEEYGNKIYSMSHYTGFRRQYFKLYEGNAGDGVAVLKVNQLRLYCLYFDNTAVFFGSGGFKPAEVRAYQDDKQLNEKAEQMKLIAFEINQAIKDKVIKVEEDGTISGTLIINDEL